MASDGPAPDEIRLPFEPGDHFVQVHANGAILVVADDYRWNLATTEQAVAVAREAVETSTRVLVGHEVLDDRTVAVLDAVRATGAEVVDFGTVVPPMTWPQGTTPLMTAAAQGRPDLLADLLDRGFPVDDRDDLGGTALHHAAQAGDAEAVRRLVEAGADAGAVDAHGRTPADLAAGAGHHDLAATLRPAGAATAGAEASGPQGGRIDFGAGPSGRLGYLLLGLAVVVVMFTVYAVQVGGPLGLLVLALAGLVAWTQRGLLRSAAPVALDGDVLEVRTPLGKRRVPLREVRGVLAVPPVTVTGGPWRLVLLQDAVGARTSPSRLRGLDALLIPAEDAERFAALADRHLVVVLGRGPRTDDVVRALRGPLDRPDVVGNRWWDELRRRLPSEVLLGSPGGA